MKRFDLKSFIVGLVLGLMVLSIAISGAVADRALHFSF